MTAPEPLGYSYVRFSDPAQAAGDSLRRQTDGSAEAFCERQGVRLDTSLKMHDKGVSAFRGKHRGDKHALGKFLDLARRGRVPAGSFLIIENLDRLSREEIWSALELVTELLKLGINIVQLMPVEQIISKTSGPMVAMMAIMELNRGHSESAAKSKRVGEAWDQRRVKARGGAILTRKLPLWVKEEAGKLVEIPERADAVRRIFELSGAGYGLNRILKKLNEEGVPAFGPSGRWSVSYIDLILKDRRAVGELQPRTKKKAAGDKDDKGGVNRPDGEPIADYFPAVVTEQQWHRARAGSIQRDRGRGRPMKDINLFGGLMREAGTGESYVVGLESGGAGHKRYRVIRSTSYRKGLGSARSFPLAIFEAAVLSLLKEINPAEVLGQEDAGAAEAMDLSARLTVVDESIRAIEADLDENGDSPTQTKRLRAREDERRAIVERQNELDRAAALPMAEAWGEALTLLDALASAPDPEDARIRLRAAVKRVIDVMTILVVGRGRRRLCAVQMRFTGTDAVRNYLVLHQPAHRGGTVVRPAQWWSRSVLDSGLDLRTPADAAAYASLLETLNLESITDTWK